MVKMLWSKTLFFALLSLSSAQTTTTTLYIPGADTQPLEASVIGSANSITTYILQCIPGTDASDCGFPDAVTLTEGPTTAAYTFKPEIDDGTVIFEGWQQCSLVGTNSAVCVESAGGVEANDPGQSTVTYSTNLPYMPVIVTARNAVATPVPQATATTTSSSGGSTSSSASGGSFVAQTTFPTSTGISKTVTAASASSTSSTSSSTAGSAVVTVNARWALGGAAAALAVFL